MPAGKEIIPHSPDFGQRRIQSECGLFAIYYPGHDIRSLAYRAGSDLQHRAEGSAGMYVSNGIETDLVRNLGTVAVAFQEGRAIPQVDRPHIGILHMRYPTSGGSNHIPNIQPLSLDGITLGHHGNLTNALELKQKLGDIKTGNDVPDSDSWLALNAIVRAEGRDLSEKLVRAQQEFEGGWVFIASDGEKIVASRDPYGIRPLSLGYIGDQEKPEGYLLSVETAPFNNLGVGGFREVLPGETIVIDENGVRTVDLAPKGEKSCIFEFVYMMRPDSIFMGENVYMTRRRAGHILWQEHPVDPKDSEVVVMAVPDSGRPSAIGYFQEGQDQYGTKIKWDEGLLANRYFGRNFIKSSGERAADLKFYTINELIRDKIIVIVDDSIVRGQTTQDNVKKMLDDGAREVHVRIASPEINHPCFWGVAFSNYKELIANAIPDLSDRTKALGVTSLGHLSLNGLFRSIGMTEEEARDAVEKNHTKFCTHCFDGNGPEIKQNGIIALRELAKTSA